MPNGSGWGDADTNWSVSDPGVVEFVGAMCSNPSKREIAFLSLGSNMGDRLANLREGIRAIGSIPGTMVTRVSGVYETEPVGVEGHGDFLNAAVRVETELTPRALLDACQTIEESFQRVRSSSPLPRRLDIDIIFFGDRVVEEEGLSIPHPRAHRRRFVLVPLAEIAPECRHPLLGVTVTELLRQAGETQRVTLIPTERTDRWED